MASSCASGKQKQSQEEDLPGQDSGASAPLLAPADKSQEKESLDRAVPATSGSPAGTPASSSAPQLESEQDPGLEQDFCPAHGLCDCDYSWWGPEHAMYQVQMNLFGRLAKRENKRGGKNFERAQRYRRLKREGVEQPWGESPLREESTSED